MPSPATLAKTLIGRQATVPTMDAPATSGVSSPGAAAGLITVLSTTGQQFINLPTGEAANLPAAYLFNRYELIERFNRRPCINADLASGTEATREPANPDFEILGTNGTSALCTFADGGGVTITTATSANDQMIILPHLDTAQTAWAASKWNTADEVYFETCIKTGATITSYLVWAGLKLTNTSTAATDDNQVYLTFNTANTLSVTGGATQFVFVTSRAGTDTGVATGVTVAASTSYNIVIAIDQNRVPRCYINGVLVAVGNGTATTGVTTSTGALTDDIDLIPYIGVQTLTTAARAITVRGLKVSKSLND